MKHLMLNLGCGSRFHPSWTNVNISKSGRNVITADLRKDFPFPNELFVVVYHSHLLEHFTKREALNFIKECHRVLRPKGIIRVAVPDLELIARNYLSALEKAQANLKGWDTNYDWMLLEMYDQATRTQSGGEMAHYLLKESISNKKFVIERCGTEVRNLIATGLQHNATMRYSNTSKKNFAKKIISLFCYPKKWKEKLIQHLLGVEYKALQIGRFRLSGENHLWMYDAYSLRRLLSECGFNDIILRSASKSYIPEWVSFNLDTEPDGSVYKPDSIFIEAIKP